jgi:hypothetical protein
MNPDLDEYQVSSLLPYLRRNACLRLCVTSPDSSEADAPQYPFLVLNDSDPTTKLLAGRFVTDAGSVLRRVFLLMQRDQYIPSADASWPVNNPDVDSAWRKAFSLYTGESEGISSLLLDGQVGSEGSLQPFSSLFYCSKKEVFFHPPCPLCGLPLRLCRDDHLLVNTGLQSYSSTTCRYLYCGSCSTLGDSRFYAYERDHASPPTLQDRWALIRSFASPGVGSDPGTSFPCGDCPEHNRCFGPDFAAGSRIVPFSFYPFHLLIFDAFTLHSRDFLSLVAGASPDEVEKRLHPLRDRARIECLADIRRDNPSGETLFPVTDERYFLEVLYLKLSFLDDVLRRVLAQPVPQHGSGMSLSLDTVWVKLPERSDRLPAWWNFRTGSIDIVRPRPEGLSFAAADPFKPLLHAGLVWFSALLCNGRLGDRDIFWALQNEAPGSDVSPFAPWEHPDSRAVFLPENIFWDPEALRVPSAWYPLWSRALHIGQELVRSALSGDRAWSGETFFRDVAVLRSEIRSALFVAVPGARKDVAREIPVLDEQGVHDALLRIAGRWRAKAQEGTPPCPVEEKDEMTETVILSARQEKRDFWGIMDTDEFMETIILSPNGKRAEIPTPPPDREYDDAIPETLIITAEQAKATDKRAESPEPASRPEPIVPQDSVPPAEDLLSETVILAPRKIDPRMKGAKGKNGS